MKNTLLIAVLTFFFFSCNDTSSSEVDQTETKKEILQTDSLNQEIDKAQEELEESMDAIDDILNTL